MANIDYLVFSADNHVDEDDDALQARLPDHLKPEAPRWEEHDGQKLRIVPGLGVINADIAMRFVENASEEVRAREYRTDPTGGRDLAVRRMKQEADGVGAEVVYPNRYMALTAHPNPEYQVAMARIYNDFLVETFFSEPDRYVPVAILPVGDIEGTVTEIERLVGMGFKAMLMPPSIPWLPYFLDLYEPVWRALDETESVPAFHVFAGNASFGGADFANTLAISPELLELGREELSTKDFEITGLQSSWMGMAHTVMGTAAGMSPLLQLTSSGVFDRYPNLQFAIVEAEAGWLPFVLESMDYMQERRPDVRKLELRASEYFRRQGHITFSYDSVSVEMIGRIGSDRMMWANDYPHDEGTYPNSTPTVARLVDNLGDATAKDLLWNNAARLFGLAKEPPRRSDAALLS